MPILDRRASGEAWELAVVFASAITESAAVMSTARLSAKGGQARKRACGPAEAVATISWGIRKTFVNP